VVSITITTAGRQIRPAEIADHLIDGAPVEVVAVADGNGSDWGSGLQRVAVYATLDRVSRDVDGWHWAPDGDCTPEEIASRALAAAVELLACCR